MDTFKAQESSSASSLKSQAEEPPTAPLRLLDDPPGQSHDTHDEHANVSSHLGRFCWEQTPLVWDAKDLSRFLGISPNTVYQELRGGSLAGIAFKVGRQYRLSRDAVRALVERGVS